MLLLYLNLSSEALSATVGSQANCLEAVNAIEMPESNVVEVGFVTLALEVCIAY